MLLVKFQEFKMVVHKLTGKLHADCPFCIPANHAITITTLWLINIARYTILFTRYCNMCKRSNDYASCVQTYTIWAVRCVTVNNLCGIASHNAIKNGPVAIRVQRRIAVFYTGSTLLNERTKFRAIKSPTQNLNTNLFPM